ncbi:MAG: hypothetical protein AAF579_16450 [Cyanobacteria bacterium P01_C01_bin.118]
MQNRLQLANFHTPPEVEGRIGSMTMILVGFASAFFPRLLASMGVPSIINFIHFGVIPGAFLITIFTTKTRDKKRINVVWQLLTAMTLFLICMLASATLNSAGIANIVLQFLFQAEPFMLLAAILALPLSGERLRRFQYWVLGFAAFNLLLAIAQSILLPIGLYPRPVGGTLQDNIGGVFGGGGGSAANYIACTVSFYVGLYFFNQFKHLKLWMRILPLVGAIYQIQISDSKQVFLALVVGWGLLAVTKVERPDRLLIYLSLFVTLIAVFAWALLNIDAEILKPYQNWIDRPIWGWDGLAARTKFAAFRIIPNHFESPLNWLFGLGPGHTVTRLGGWVMRDYESLLQPLGATIHPVSAQVFNVVLTTYLAQESTVYFPLFTWAGIWGDGGIIGLITYLFMGFIVWKQVCVDDFGKFLLLSTVAFGCILTQMEEPGHMLTIACLLGLRWQEQREKQLLQRQTRIN